MGEYLREWMQRRDLDSDPTPRPASRHPLVIASAVVGVVMLIAGVVRLSVVAAIFALVFGAAGWAWWRSERDRGLPSELRFAALCLVCLLVGFFGWLLGMIKGW